MSQNPYRGVSAAPSIATSEGIKVPERRKDKLDLALEDVDEHISVASERTLRAAASSLSVKHRAKCLTERVKRGKRDMEKANEELNTMLDEANALLKEETAGISTAQATLKAKDDRLLTVMQLDLKVLNQGQKDEEKKCNDYMDQEFEATFIKQIAEVQDMREATLSATHRDFKQHIMELEKGIDMQKENRTKKDKAARDSLAKMLDDTRKRQKDARLVREASEAKMAQRLEEMYDRMRQELGRERDERNSNEEHMVNILEESCARVERSVEGMGKQMTKMVRNSQLLKKEIAL
jgi:hypothetical protein